MGRYGYRRRYRYSYGRNATSSKRQSVSDMYGGIDEDIRKMFFQLDAFKLKLLFNKYEKEYGDGKRKYAESAYEKWKSGKVQMGGEISERLIKIVPRFLDFDQKFTLINKLWNKLRTKNHISVSFSPESQLNDALCHINNLIDQTRASSIPDSVAERLDWLSQDDSQLAQKLLDQIEDQEIQQSQDILLKSINDMLSASAGLNEHSFSGVHKIELPAAILTININSHSPVLKDARTMDEENKSSGDNERNNELAPIENTNDLLGEALKRMSPKKQEEIVAKATDEALRLQVKQKEGDLDHEMSTSKLDDAVQAARQLGNSNADFEYNSEHRSEHGHVNVTVKTKNTSLSKRVGGCFVATATFGDFSHPSVIELRKLRDQRLRKNLLGRSFIRSYYKYGPALARNIESSAFLRAACLTTLMPIVFLAKFVNKDN